MKAKKMDATEQLLGENRILNDSANELWPHYLAANKEKIKNASGESAWNQLSQLEQDEHNTQMLEHLIANLGIQKKWLKKLTNLHLISLI